VRAAIRYRRHDAGVFMWALRREPLERRKATLARLLARAGHGMPRRWGSK
jgi:hypothetical protein